MSRRFKQIQQSRFALAGCGCLLYPVEPAVQRIELWLGALGFPGHHHGYHVFAVEAHRTAAVAVELQRTPLVAQDDFLLVGARLAPAALTLEDQIGDASDLFFRGFDDPPPTLPVVIQAAAKRAWVSFLFQPGTGDVLWFDHETGTD